MYLIYEERQAPVNHDRDMVRVSVRPVRHGQLYDVVPSMLNVAYMAATRRGRDAQELEPVGEEVAFLQALALEELSQHAEPGCPHTWSGSPTSSLVRLRCAFEQGHDTAGDSIQDPGSSYET
jgi:hypothetical protein